jgi:hypothetical protein
MSGLKVTGHENPHSNLKLPWVYDNHVTLSICEIWEIYLNWLFLYYYLLDIKTRHGFWRPYPFSLNIHDRPFVYFDLHIGGISTTSNSLLEDSTLSSAHVMIPIGKMSRLSGEASHLIFVRLQIHISARRSAYRVRSVFVTPWILHGTYLHKRPNPHPFKLFPNYCWEFSCYSTL